MERAPGGERDRVVPPFGQELTQRDYSCGSGL